MTLTWYCILGSHHVIDGAVMLYSDPFGGADCDQSEEGIGVGEGTSDILLNDEIPFESIPRSALRRLISYVAQRPFLFPATIEENIRVGTSNL